MAKLQTIEVRVYEPGRDKDLWWWSTGQQLQDVSGMSIDGYPNCETREAAQEHARKCFAEYLPDCEIKFVE
jgi:hypothetical protein